MTTGHLARDEARWHRKARTEALASVNPVPYYVRYGENVWAGVKGHLDAVTERAARPVIAKYTGVLAAADIEVFTMTTTFAIMQSLRLDKGPSGPVHPDQTGPRGRPAPALGCDWSGPREEGEVTLARTIVTSAPEDERRNRQPTARRVAGARSGSGDSSRGAWLQHARSHLRDADPALARLIDDRPAFDPRAWMTQLPAMDLYGALLFQVAGQQLSVPATRRTLARIEELFGGHLPAPAELLAVEPARLREAGLSWRKVGTLRDLAERLSDGRLDQDVLRDLPDDELMAALTAIPGIGPWTVQGALIIALGREDVVLPGDLALRKAIRLAYQLDHLPTQQEVLAIAEKWRPYRSLATSYLFSAAFESTGPAQLSPPET